MKVSYIKLGEEKRPVCFSLSAIDRLNDEFGDLDGMREKLVSGNVKSVIRVLEILLDAGTAYCRGMGIPCPPPLACSPGDLIGIGDRNIVSDLFEAMRQDGERSVETQSKN